MLIVCVLGLIVLRLAMAALLPLSADEAYYWLWSRHLAAGYYDHPPVIAFLIRAGTALFGDTGFGVRAAAVLLSLPASWFVFDAARVALGDRERAAWAALFFNLTLMMGFALLAATPDAPSIATAAAYIWCLVRIQASGPAGEGRRGKTYWLAAGFVAGLSLLSKYAMFFLGAGTLVWLLLDLAARRWLFTPWPYLGALVALLVFAPNLIWQAGHHWITFAFQFGRIGDGHLTARYVVEFAAAQIGLATPLLFALTAAGLWRGTRARMGARFALAVLVWTALAYFLFHALRDRVQGNWPCFLYAALAILAADAGGRRWWRPAAAGLATVLLLALYAQALWGVVALKSDPLARLLGRGVPAVVQGVAVRADFAVTTDYETTAWLRWYAPGLKVAQINEAYRYPDAPVPEAMRERVFYLVPVKRDARNVVRQTLAPLGPVRQLRAGAVAYNVFPVLEPRQAAIGKMP